jgi:hypothetical protein
LAAIWGAIFHPQEVPAKFLALIDWDCQQPMGDNLAVVNAADFRRSIVG